ncbi:hypothetical protein VUR80DRAFT_6400 [Thermomyces stellatus]
MSRLSCIPKPLPLQPSQQLAERAKDRCLWCQFNFDSLHALEDQLTSTRGAVAYSFTHPRYCPLKRPSPPGLSPLSQRPRLLTRRQCQQTASPCRDISNKVFYRRILQGDREFVLTISPHSTFRRPRFNHGPDTLFLTLPFAELLTPLIRPLISAKLVA